MILSRELAVTTNEWAVRDASPMEIKFTIKMAPSDCKSLFVEYENQVATFDELFSSCRMLKLVYEDRGADFMDSVKKVEDFLGVEQLPLHPRPVKQRKKPIREIVADYSEISSYFKGSRWEGYFV